MPARKRPSPAQRGYNDAHRKRADNLRHNHIDGTICWWCGLPMFKDRTKNIDYDPEAKRRDGKPDLTSGVLHADHPEGKDGGKLPTRLMHGGCNKERGDGSRDHERPALKLIQASPLGDLAMGWPAT